MSRVLRAFLAVAAGVAIAITVVTPAQAATVETIEVSASLSPEGVLDVTQSLILSGSGLETWSQDLPTRLTRDGKRYTFDVIDIAVKANGAPIDFTVSDSATAKTVTFSTAAGGEFVLSYRVEGVTTAAAEEMVKFSWPMVVGASADITRVSGKLILPFGAVNNDCQTGVVGGLVNCTAFSAGMSGDSSLTFQQRPLNVGSGVYLEVTFGPGTMVITENVTLVWTLGNAFTPGAIQLVITALLLLCGGLGLFLGWRRVTFAGNKVQVDPVAEFVTDANGSLVFKTDPVARPGLVGTLADSQVDPCDILGAILDLAVRGHLRITELKTAGYEASDWKFTRREGADELMPYEVQLLDILTQDGLTVDEMGDAVVGAIPSVQDAIYQQVMEAGWFSRLPSQKAKSVLWAWIGVGVAAVATIALTVFTTFALVGIALLGVAVVGLIIAQQAPHWTAKGAAIYGSLHGLAAQLQVDRRAEIADEEKYVEISKVLPYAVVLGGWDEWVDALATADDDPDPDPEDLDWYHAPEDWNLSDLPHSLDAFITVVTGRLFARL
jgi:hypothetical protein